MAATAMRMAVGKAGAAGGAAGCRATAWGPVDGREDDAWQYSEQAGPGLVGGRLPTLTPAAVAGCKGLQGFRWEGCGSPTRRQRRQCMR